jgi:hypothetical protein
MRPLYTLNNSPLYSLTPVDSPSVPFVDSTHSTFLQKTVHIYRKCLISVDLQVDMRIIFKTLLKIFVQWDRVDWIHLARDMNQPRVLGTRSATYGAP